MDPHTSETESEVRNNLHLQRIANEMPEAFTNTKEIVKSHIPVVNAPERIEIPLDEDSPKEFRTLNSREPNARKSGSEPVVRVPKKPRVQAEAKTPRRRPTEKKPKQTAHKKNIEGESQTPGVDVQEVPTQSENAHIIETHIERPENT